MKDLKFMKFEKGKKYKFRLLPQCPLVALRDRGINIGHRRNMKKLKENEIEIYDAQEQYSNKQKGEPCEVCRCKTFKEVEISGTVVCMNCYEEREV